MNMSVSNHISDRYNRQLILKGFGEKAQEKLASAKILVIGAGGLGCPALLYLVAAGVGQIGIVDHDQVSLSNLHRQVLYDMDDIGKPKASMAALKLGRLNDQVTITPLPIRLQPTNCLGLLAEYDIILDGTDNFAARYMVNDACVLLDKPLVYGAVSQYEGQVAIFNVGETRTNYRDLFPHPPAAGEVLNCAEAGVLGVLPGIIGTMQAAEAIKLITGIGQPLVNRLYTFNVLGYDSYELIIEPTPLSASLIPPDAEHFSETNYDWLCGLVSTEFEIDNSIFHSLLSKENTLIIDVREEGETPLADGFPHRQLPLSLLKEKLQDLEAETVVFFCQSGKRSLQAAQWLKEINGPVKNIFSLQGGILNWRSPISE
ncbi:ThiF family adenylyltransferase [Flavihumibacter stibioxidans]|uniref:Rhodanese domain-containing protein n=1 Tax=Flavihumibacter stibioxidans TaxID=1834163 RepID=A0ABR7MBA5_9BACT|nr:HesA/MoeB/ThiF family protein [Flavihumibacter stibioxidans]MBC6492320.1 hypothetical protein [Flavihumibacter stibioxidans]